MTPELPTPPDQEHDPRQRERVLELVLLGLVVVVVGAVGLPPAVASLRDGSLELAAVFYPLLLVAFAGLAWSRRNGA